MSEASVQFIEIARAEYSRIQSLIEQYKELAEFMENVDLAVEEGQITREQADELLGSV